MNANPEAGPEFQHVCDMETSLRTATDVLRALTRIAETLDDEDGAIVQQLSWLAIRECEKVEALRGDLFKLTHPQRAHFDRVGWPA